MGKGDRRTKRGKIFQGTTGKYRPKKKKTSTKPANAENKEFSLIKMAAKFKLCSQFYFKLISFYQDFIIIFI